MTVVIFRLLVRNSASWSLVQFILQAETLLIFGAVWTCLRTGDFLLERLNEHLRQRKQETIIILLGQLNKFFRMLLILGGVMMWLDNLGFKVTTLLTGVGLGGAALALAAQSMLKNIFGNIMILLDKPFSVGHRVLVSGYDGVIEDIGVRSTKLRLLNGDQVILPNEEMAAASIENISRRPFIRHKADIKFGS